MAVDDYVRVAQAISGLLQAVAWPLVVLWLIHKFSPFVRDFLANMTEGSIKAFGVEATAKRNAAIDIAQAEIVKFVPTPGETTVAAQAANSIRTAEAVTSKLSLDRLAGKRVLWIDERFEETFYERSALHQLGMRVEVVRHMPEAFEYLHDKSADIAVLVNPPYTGTQTTVERLLSVNIPYIVYGKVAKDDPVTKAVTRFALATVSKASDLTLAITNNVGRTSNSDARQSYVGFTEHLEALRRR